VLQVKWLWEAARRAIDWAFDFEKSRKKSDLNLSTLKRSADISVGLFWIDSFALVASRTQAYVAICSHFARMHIMMIKDTDFLGGLAKGLKVIEAFTAEKERMSISDVSTATGLDRATARRCLLTLHSLGYASYDGKYFSLTPRVLRLGTGSLATMPLPRILQPRLDLLSTQIGQSVSVSISGRNRDRIHRPVRSTTGHVSYTDAWQPVACLLHIDGAGSSVLI